VISIQTLSKLAVEVALTLPLPRLMHWAGVQLSASHLHLYVLGFALLGAKSCKKNCPPCPSSSGTSDFHVVPLIPQSSGVDDHYEVLQLNLSPNTQFTAILIHQHASNCYICLESGLGSWKQ